MSTIHATSAPYSNWSSTVPNIVPTLNATRVTPLNLSSTLTNIVSTMNATSLSHLHGSSTVPSIVSTLNATREPYWNLSSTVPNVLKNLLLNTQRFPTDDTKRGYFYIFFSLFAIANLVGNSVLIAAISKTERLHTITNYFVMALACSDLSLAVTILPINVISKLIYISTEELCILMYVVPVCFSLAMSVFMLLSIAVDRYIAIMRPLHYHQIMTLKRAKVIILCISFYSLMMACFPLMGWNNTKYRPQSNCPLWTKDNCYLIEVLPSSYIIFTYGQLVIVVIIVISLYGRIYSTARMQARKQHALQPVAWSNNSNSRKGTLVLFLMVSCFALSWLTITIVYFIEFDYLQLDILCTYKVALGFHYFGYMTSFAGSAVNPFLYGFANKEVARAMKALFPCLNRNAIAPFSK